MSSTNQSFAASPALSDEHWATPPEMEEQAAPHVVSNLSFVPAKEPDHRPGPHDSDRASTDAAPTADAPEAVNVLQQVSKATASIANDAAANVSKEELAKVLEGFAQVLRADPTYSSITFANHMAEVSQLKALLLEAQETIINLLNDRVYDRARLAKLEAELRFMPDLQAQANRAMNLAKHSEGLQDELSQVRAEVERLRTSYMREKGKSGWLSKILGR